MADGLAEQLIFDDLAQDVSSENVCFLYPGSFLGRNTKAEIDQLSEAPARFARHADGNHTLSLADLHRPEHIGGVSTGR